MFLNKKMELQGEDFAAKERVSEEESASGRRIPEETEEGEKCG